VLEGNPVARRLGWKFGVPLNLALALGFGLWPLLAISLTTTSLLVAARNLQSAWLMRSMGELDYRCWIADRIAEVWAHPGTAERLRHNAADLLRRTYTWDAIAASTVDVYRVALG
jgi:hypothetical protein